VGFIKSIFFMNEDIQIIYIIGDLKNHFNNNNNHIIKKLKYDILGTFILYLPIKKWIHQYSTKRKSMIKNVGC